MSDTAHWLQDAINNLLNHREQGEFLQILSDFHGRRVVRDLAYSLEGLLDTPAKRQLIPLLRHVIPKSDRPDFDRHISRIFPANSGSLSKKFGGYPKSVLKKSPGSSSSMPAQHYLTMPSRPTGRPNSATSYIQPFSKSTLPNWEAGIINQVCEGLPCNSNARNNDL